MEHRKEYDIHDQINCPKCGSDNLKFDEHAEDKAKCVKCGTQLTLKQVVIWEE